MKGANTAVSKGGSKNKSEEKGDNDFAHAKYLAKGVLKVPDVGLIQSRF